MLMLKYLKKYWFFAILAPLFMLGEAGMDLVQPRLMSTIVDEGVLGLSNNHVGDLSIVIRTGLEMISEKMLSLNLSFGAVIACALPLVLFTVIFFLSKANPKFTILQSKLDGVNNAMQENVSGARVVKAYVKEDYEQRRFQRANDELVSTQLDVLLLLSYMTPIIEVGQ